MPRSESGPSSRFRVYTYSFTPSDVSYILIPVDTDVLTISWRVSLLSDSIAWSQPSLGDTVLHSWEVLGKILESEEVSDILCDVGMYVFVLHRNSMLS